MFLKALLLGVIICQLAQAKTTIEQLTNQIFRSGATSGSTSNPITDISTESYTKTTLPEQSTESSSECTCVPYYLCKNGAINTNGEGIIDVRQGDQCSNYFETCCKSNQTTTDTIKPTPPPVQRTGCGQYNRDGKAFKMTGNFKNESNFAEFPWMVAVLYEQSTGENLPKLTTMQCGGSLINPQVVITAAHCVRSRKQFKIRAGEWDTKNTEEIYPYQERDVEHIEIHPFFYEGALYYNIALLFLKTPVEIAENVNVVCLPRKETTFNYARCFATGWGKIAFGKEGIYSNILKKINLPVIPNNECQTSLRTTRLGKAFQLHASFICAGGEEGQDTCTGDGGSPLVCPILGEENRYQQAGIVSWGVGCGGKYPAAYANVALFRDWIDNQLQIRGVNISSYQL